MKWIGSLAVFLLCAASMYISLSRRSADTTHGVHQVPGTPVEKPNWDQKNRRPANSVFFMKPPEWMRGSKAKTSEKTDPKRTLPVSSGQQANPFAE